MPAKLLSNNAAPAEMTAICVFLSVPVCGRWLGSELLAVLAWEELAEEVCWVTPVGTRPRCELFLPLAVGLRFKV